jgi:hypothetical protein
MYIQSQSRFLTESNSSSVNSFYQGAILGTEIGLTHELWNN